MSREKSIYFGSSEKKFNATLAHHLLRPATLTWY